MTTSEQRISVLIITYDSARHLRECVESVLSQTLRPWEIIICDDCSRDDSFAIAEEYARRYPDLVHAHRQPQNLGPAGNGNVGRRMAGGEFFAKIDGDDRWLPEKLEREWKSLQEHPEARIAYSGVFLINDAGGRITEWKRRSGPAGPGGDVFIDVFSRHFFADTRSVFRDHLIHRSLFDEAGYYDESLESYWDWDEKIRFTARYPVAFSGASLVEYRTHASAFSRKDPARHIRAMHAIYEKHLPLLDGRSGVEAAQVRCSVETLLALQQDDVPSSDRMSPYLPDTVEQSNTARLEGLPPDDRRDLVKTLAPDFVRLHILMIREGLQKRNIASVLASLPGLLRHLASTDFRFKTAALLRMPRWTWRQFMSLLRGAGREENG